jgi:hypothetical protein
VRGVDGSQPPVLYLPRVACRKNHIVSSVYLRQWAASNNRLAVVTPPRSEPEMLTPEGADRVVWEYGDAIATGRHMGAGGLEIIANDPQAFRRACSNGLGCAEYRVP